MAMIKFQKSIGGINDFVDLLYEEEQGQDIRSWFQTGKKALHSVNLLLDAGLNNSCLRAKETFL